MIERSCPSAAEVRALYANCTADDAVDESKKLLVEFKTPTTDSQEAEYRQNLCQTLCKPLNRAIEEYPFKQKAAMMLCYQG